MMERTFDNLRTEAWSRLAPLRQATCDEPLIQWWKLDEPTSVSVSEVTTVGRILCGLTVYTKGFFRKKTIAEIHLAYQCDGDDCHYQISSWRKGFSPIVIFPSKKRGVHFDLEQAVGKMKKTVDVIESLLAEGKIKTSFPSEWTGKSFWHR